MVYMHGLVMDVKENGLHVWLVNEWHGNIVYMHEFVKPNRHHDLDQRFSVNFTVHA